MGARLTYAQALLRVEQAFPRRARATFAREATAEEQRELGSSGVLRDRKGRPKYDANQLHMSPPMARGLGEDHGTYHEMLRSDGAIAGVSALLKREVTRTHYRVRPPKTETPLGLEVTDFVRRYLGFDGTTGWLVGGLRRLLEQACQSFDYGFAPFELAWAEKTWRGRTVWVPDRVEHRAPWSVDGWLWQGTRLVGMRQLVPAGQTSGRSIFSIFGTQFNRVTIPVNKLLLFTHEHVDGNPEGTSMLRPAWIYWRWKKDTISRNQAAEDRLYGGVTLLKEVGDGDGRPAPSLDAEVEKNAHLALADLARGILEFMTVPFGYQVEQSHPGFDIPSPVDRLMYCDRQIFLSLSAVLLGLDASHAGSKSLSQDLGGLLWKSLAAAADEIVDVINGIEGVETSGLIRKLIDANYDVPEDFEYPRLEHVGLEHQDLAVLADTMVKLSDAGLLSDQVEDEVFLRLAADLPELVVKGDEDLDDVKKSPEIFAYHYTNGILTRNEGRESLGLDEDTTPAGDLTVPEYLAQIPTPGNDPEVIADQEAATDAT